MFPAHLPVLQKFISRTGITSSVFTFVDLVTFVIPSLHFPFPSWRCRTWSSANIYYQPWPLQEVLLFFLPLASYWSKKVHILLKSRVLTWCNHFSRTCPVLTICKHLITVVQSTHRLWNKEEAFPASSQQGAWVRKGRWGKRQFWGFWPVWWKWSNISKFVRADGDLFQRSTTAAGLILRLSSCAVQCTLTTLSQTLCSNWGQAQSLHCRKHRVKWHTSTAKHPGTLDLTASRGTVRVMMMRMIITANKSSSTTVQEE